jgi:hypothetical protein
MEPGSTSAHLVTPSMICCKLILLHLLLFSFLSATVTDWMVFSSMGLDLETPDDLDEEFQQFKIEA